ncbi:MAG: glycoside hydrolase family 3 C-terminal domain-containing protein, partial [Bacteroidota bacterium]
IHGHEGMGWGEGTYDSEAGDKENIKLMFGQEALINNLAAANPNMAVVIMGGSNVEMANWMGNVPSLLQAWYAGMEGGNALANILFGEVSPSGKLPMTFANSHLDYPSHTVGQYPGQDGSVEYTEGVMVGYRYFDTEDIAPIFPFGHGLSYTSFEYSDLTVDKQGDAAVLTFSVTNTGSVAGAEVAQVYVHDVESSVVRPLRELKGFEKVNLEAGASTQVSVVLPASAFQYYSEADAGWVLEPGAFQLQVGSSSRDIRLTGEVSW